MKRERTTYGPITIFACPQKRGHKLLPLLCKLSEFSEYTGLLPLIYGSFENAVFPSFEERSDRKACDMRQDDVTQRAAEYGLVNDRPQGGRENEVPPEWRLLLHY